jgi:hypothetical protein
LNYPWDEERCCLLKVIVFILKSSLYFSIKCKLLYEIKCCFLSQIKFNFFPFTQQSNQIKSFICAHIVSYLRLKECRYWIDMMKEDEEPADKSSLIVFFLFRRKWLSRCWFVRMFSFIYFSSSCFCISNANCVFPLIHQMIH